MYESFYGLTRLPFQLLPDTDFFYRSKKHDRALTCLEYGVYEKAGFIVITGEIGTGKTTLLRYLLRSLDIDLPIALLNQTHLPPEDFFRILCREFSLPYGGKGKSELIELFGTFLVDQYRQSRYVRLILDEAQNLPLDTLEEIRLISNLDTDSERLLQIILVGQPPLRRKLQDESLSQLLQRIEVSYHLEPLDREEIQEYIHFRLASAGARDPELFDQSTIQTIYNCTGGVPRLINLICHRCLVYGFADRQKKITRDLLKKVLEDRKAEGLYPESIIESSAQNQAMTDEASNFKDSPEPFIYSAQLTAALNRFTDISGASMKAVELAAAKVAKRADDEQLALLKKQLEESNSVRTHARAKNVKNAIYQKDAALTAKKNQLKLTVFGLLAAIVFVAFVGSIDLKMGSKVKTAASRHVGRVTLEEKASSPARSDTLAEPQQPADNAESFSETPVQEAPKAATKLQRHQPAEEIIAYNKKHEPSSPEPMMVANPSLKESRSREAESNEQKKTAATGSVEFTPQKITKEFRPTTLELAAAALKQQNFERAIELLEADRSLDAQKSSKARELYSEALTGRAGQIMERSPLEAETMMRKAVEADPKNIRAHFELGKIYTQTKKYAQAIDAYQNAVALNPNFSDAFFNLGFIYATTGNYKEAESVFTRVVNLKPTYLYKALFNLALVQERLGKKQESLENLKKAVTVRPENKKIQAYLKQVETIAKESP